MVNEKTIPATRKQWWSNNIVGVIVAALFAAFFAQNGMHQTQAYQDKQLQTETNLEVLLQLQHLNDGCNVTNGVVAEIKDGVDENHEAIQGLDSRTTILETTVGINN